VRPDLKDILFNIISSIGEKAEAMYERDEEYSLFVSGIFDAIEDDISQRMGSGRKIKTISALSGLLNDFNTMLLLYIQNKNPLRRRLIEKEISYIGNKVIGCLNKIIFSYDDPVELYHQLKQTIPYMGIFRLKDDINFLDNLKTELEENKIKTEDDDEIMLLTDISIELIKKNSLSLDKGVGEGESLFFPPYLKNYI